MARERATGAGGKPEGMEHRPLVEAQCIACRAGRRQRTEDAVAMPAARTGADSAVAIREQLVERISYLASDDEGFERPRAGKIVLLGRGEGRRQREGGGVVA